MAGAGRPVVGELYPLGGAVSLGATLVDSSGSPMTEISASGLTGGPGCVPLEEPEDHATTPPTGEAHCTGLRDVLDPGGQELSCTCGLVTTHTSSRQHELVENAGRAAQSAKPASLHACRSHSGPRPPVGLGTPPRGPDSQTETRSTLACQLPVQLVTTVCRGATSEDPGAPQPPHRCACAASPKAEGEAEGVKTGDHPPSKCDETLHCGSFIHQGNFEETFAAYCHPQPILAPSQSLPCQVEPSRDTQCVAAPPLAMNHLTLPRLISSVSETGLDAKHLLRCCSVSCPWVSMAPPGAGLQSQQHFGLEGCCSCPIGHAKATTRDMGTMTAHRQLRDVGVQTGRTAPPHVFPQVCLAEETQSETPCRQTPNSDSDGGGKAGGAPKSPVKEVKWDAEGMTWEVYGASVDPEELGLAIQRHLELQIKETANRATKLTRQNTSTSRQSGGNGSQRKRSRMMGSIRTPACCTRSTTAVD